MRHLVKHRVGEEGIEGDVPALLRGDETLGDRNEDPVELRAHRVLELQPPGALRQLNVLVVRQVDGDGLRARVAVPGVVDDVVGVEVRIGAGLVRLVDRRHRQAALQFRQEPGEARELPAPALVLDEHVRGVGGAISEQLVLVGFDRADHDVDLVVLHVHPGEVARQVVVRDQRARA